MGKQIRNTKNNKTPTTNTWEGDERTKLHQNEFEKEKETNLVWAKFPKWIKYVYLIFYRCKKFLNRP